MSWLSNPPEKYAVLVNIGANGGRAARRWQSIAAHIGKILPPDTAIHLFQPPDDVTPVLRQWLDAGVRGFISAGGDGSANQLLQWLMENAGSRTSDLWLGGIGLGSSNDFIKPLGQTLHGLPLRLGLANAVAADVGQVQWENEQGETRTSHFLINASMGVTAEANWYFNQGDAVIRFLKNRWTTGAIVYTAIRTILSYRNIQVRMAAAAFPETNMALSNLAILKSPYVSGSFHYDDPVKRDDGQLGVHLCHDMGRLELLRILAVLANGRFRGMPKTLSFSTDQVHILPGRPAPLELDGEVYLCRSARFSVCKAAIQLMGISNSPLKDG